MMREATEREVKIAVTYSLVYTKKSHDNPAGYMENLLWYLFNNGFKIMKEEE